MIETDNHAYRVAAAAVPEPASLCWSASASLGQHRADEDRWAARYFVPGRGRAAPSPLIHARQLRAEQAVEPSEAEQAVHLHDDDGPDRVDRSCTSVLRSSLHTTNNSLPGKYSQRNRALVDGDATLVEQLIELLVIHTMRTLDLTVQVRGFRSLAFPGP